MSTGSIDSPQVIGARLRELRLALGYDSSTEFARHIGITVQALSNWERGWRRITLDEAVKLRAKTGITYEWLYHGDESGLTKRIADKLAAQRTGQGAESL